MCDYIYLLHEREFIKTKENIFKLGKFTQEYLQKLEQYPNGSRLLLHIVCENCDIIEAQLNEEFSKKYIQRQDIGVQYFEGDYKYMIQDIYEKIILKKKDDNDELNVIIDKAIISNEKQDIAKIVYILYKDTIKVENCKWYHFDKDEKTWRIANEGSLIRIALSTKICNKLQERAYYYNQKCKNLSEEDKAQNLYYCLYNQSLKIALQLKNTNYKNEIMGLLYHMFSDKSI